MYGLTLISSTLSQRRVYEKKPSLCNLSNYLNKKLKDHWEDLWTQWNCEEKVPQPWLPSGWGQRLLPEIWKRQPTVIPFTPSQSVTNFLLWHLLLLHLVVYCSEMQLIKRNPWVETYGGLTFIPHCHPSFVSAPFFFYLIKCPESERFYFILLFKCP